MLNPNLHIICGKCGCNHMFEYKVEIETDDELMKNILSFIFFVIIAVH